MAGFLLNLSQVQYTPEGAKMSALLTHNQKKVLGVEAQASFTVSQNYNFTPVSGSVALDLAGMTQVKADIPSYDKANSAFKDLEKGGGIAQLSAAAARLESSVNSAIYYGGCDVAQAKAGVDIVPIEGKQDGYKIVPMVRFGDGSSLAVDDYFSENNFGTLVTQMQNWLEEIERYIKSLQPLNIKL